MSKSTLMLPSRLMMVAIVLMSGAGSAIAEGNVTASIANGKTIVTQGKGEAPACVTCHGEKLLGIDAMGTPRLANIGYTYVVKQLTDFAADRRTPAGLGAAMNGFAKALSEQDRRDVAAYVNTLEYKTEPSDLKALEAEGQQIGKRYLGKRIVMYGIAGKLNSCESCHGYNGRGADPIFPAINQQKYVYLVNQLKNWRDGSRNNDPKIGGKVPVMQTVAKKMTDDDIINAATYLSSAPRVSAGGGRVLDNSEVLHRVLGVHP
ncbi:MAG: c-type cytochrome [Pseudomonadota bacterium]